MQKRTIFIGDVHGCYDELIALVEKVRLTPEDHLYFCGDLINKGPKSREVVEWIHTRPNTWSVIGNHEYFSLSDFIDVDSLGHLDSGHRTWIKNSLAKSESTQEEVGIYKDWILSFPPIIETPEFILVHGGIHPDYGVDTPIEIATLLRLYNGKPWYEYYTGTKPIIYGHWAVEGLRIRPNTIGLDTGCCFGGFLTAYILETKEILQVRANGVYKEPSHWRETRDV